MNTITHPFIAPGRLESRTYQLSIAMKALEGHTMIVLPTGLGKTAIALLVAASRLYNEGGRVVMMAPTKPLVEQHLRFFRQFLSLPSQDEDTLAMFTGETPSGERAAAWKKARMVFATPQVIKNDVLAGSYDFRDVSLVIFDECHRAVGNYAYVFLAQRYLETAASPLVLAMTASPGGQVEKVEDVCRNLGIVQVESRTEHDRDVAPYIHEREIEVVEVDLPPELKQAASDLNALVDSRLTQLKHLGFRVPPRQQLSMKALQALNAQVQEQIQARESSGYAAASIYAELMKLRHALSLAESQGSRVLAGYITRLFSEGSGGSGPKATARLARDPVFIRLLERCMSWKEELHPKMEILSRVVKGQLESSPESRIIVFATFRDMVQQIVDHLNSEGIACQRFVGQATKDSEKGLSQKRQIEALQKFRAGDFRVLVATSVGEEGLDVPSTDLVVFYEAVPSEIRSIQRKGRTGRSGKGRIVVLVTKGTSDEVFRYVSQNRERSMLSGITRISPPSQGLTWQRAPPPVQSRIGEFSGRGPEVRVDDRETSSKVVEVLSNMGVSLIVGRLSSGDYAIGDRILIERKTARDFVDTLVERDLFGQLKGLAESAPRPVLIIEGGDLYTARDIHPNAVRGALAAIAVDLGISVLFTKDEEDTAQMILVLARREEGGDRERTLPMKRHGHSFGEQQELVIASFPDIGLKNARLLLDHFGSVRAVVNATEEELLAVRGIGEQKSRKIHELASRPYR
ncbi:MAG: putative ski2-type helicase [Methanoregulaceae archaeon PtaB.Bin056]|nr:MAG: putative ski2-type helicase [Methanoregulaceae archaeon PtaB.Bin056]